MEKTMEKTTQCDRIVRYMTIHGSITNLEALNELGVLNGKGRICDLRKCGYSITTTMIPVKNRWGETSHIARYTFTNDERAQKPFSYGGYAEIPFFEGTENELDELVNSIKEVPMDKVGGLNE